jgi:hypothetical protein
VAEFYRKQLLEQKIGFPDKYYLLSANEAELRKRKEGDITRRRGGFEMNLQHTYSIELFDFMTNWLNYNKASDFLLNDRILIFNNI